MVVRRNPKRCWKILFLLFIILGSCQIPFQSSSTRSIVAALSVSDLQDGAEDEKKVQIKKKKIGSQKSLNDVLVKAGKSGLGGGIASLVQVITLMWLRTIINYQSRYGTSFVHAFSVLYREGGIGRLYRGLSFALIQAPLSRFVSTASNDGIQALLLRFEATKMWGVGRSTMIAGIVVGIWRMILMPIDTCKVVLQVDGKDGFRNLMRRVKNGKFNVLYQGAFANAISSSISHYPWFFIYNTLSKSKKIHASISSQLLRNGCVGLAASIVSDTCVNSLRVIKTTKQSLGSKHEMSYFETIRIVLASDGWRGLFGRGLTTRILSNALQSALFTIIWRGLAERWGDKESHTDEKNSKGGDK